MDRNDIQAEPVSGGTQRGVGPRAMRAHNERLILGMLHSAGTLSAAEIARRSGLSAQAISVIVRQLGGEGLILRGDPVRGKVGQPTVPISVNPDGTFILGAKIGRRSADIALVGLNGRVRQHHTLPYEWPDPQTMLRWLRDMSAQLGSSVHKISALGIALPSRLWNWADDVAEAHLPMKTWHGFDLVAELKDLPYPVLTLNDGSAACAAEMTFGTLPHGDDVIYLFIGTFIGGGIAQKGKLLLGPTGNAGSFGSMLVQRPDGTMRQLIDMASLIGLERMLRKEKGKHFAKSKSSDAWNLDDPMLDAWITEAAYGIAQALVSVKAVTDSRLAVIDGAMPKHVLDVLLHRIGNQMALLPLAGLDPPTLQRGTLGSVARALGAAAFAMNEQFFAWPADLHRLASKQRP